MSKYYYFMRGRDHFQGNEAEWKDLIFPAINLAIGVAAPTIATQSNIRYYVFAGGTVGTADELHGCFELQHDYKEGTDLYLHTHWFATTSGTGGVRLGVDYGCGTPGSALSFQEGVEVTARTIEADETNIMRVTNIATIPGTGKTIGTNCMFRIYRPIDEYNTYADPIGILTVGVHYQCDTLGSRGITTK